MGNDSGNDSLILPLPDRCPGCRVDWEAGVCPRCGLTLEEVRGLMKRGLVSYDSARAAALAGDFHAARLHLAAVRSSGIPALTEHNAVVRLTELCGLASIKEVPVPPVIAPDSKSTTKELPEWLVPLSVGGGAFGVAALFIALFALLLATVAVIFSLLAFLHR